MNILIAWKNFFCCVELKTSFENQKWQHGLQISPCFLVSVTEKAIHVEAIRKPGSSCCGYGLLKEALCISPGCANLNDRICGLLLCIKS